MNSIVVMTLTVSTISTVVMNLIELAISTVAMNLIESTILIVIMTLDADAEKLIIIIADVAGGCKNKELEHALYIKKDVQGFLFVKVPV